MHGLEEVMEKVKDNDLRRLIETGNFEAIILGEYPYYVKKEILKSNKDLKQWFKNLVEERCEYLCELVNNNPFLIYQLSLLYYSIFKFKKVPEKLLAHLKIDCLLFDFEDGEKKLCEKYLNEIIIPKTDCVFDNLRLTTGVIKLIIPALSIVEDPFYDFENNMYFWYNVWTKFEKEILVKAQELSLKNNYINSYFVLEYKDALKLIFELILEDKRLLEHFNPFFLLGFKNRIGHYCDMNVVPLFIGFKENVLRLFVELLLKINEKTRDYDCTTIEKAGHIIKLCIRAIENYPEYYEERKNGLGSYESIYYTGLLKLGLNWIKFTIYGIDLELLVKYPPIFEKESEKDEKEEKAEKYVDEATRLALSRKMEDENPVKNIQKISH